MTRGQNFFSKPITIAAGAETEVFSGMYSTIIIIAGTATDYTADIALKIGKMGFRNLPTGVEFSPEGDPFGSFQLKNTGVVEHSVHVLAALGSIRNYNLQLNGDVSISAVTQSAAVLALFNRMADALDAIEVTQGALVVDAAAVETLITATNSKLDTIDGVLDSVKTNTDAMVTDLAAIELTQDQIVTNTTP